MPKNIFKKISSHLHKSAKKSASYNDLDISISRPNANLSSPNILPIIPIPPLQQDQLEACPICSKLFKVQELENHAANCVVFEQNEESKNEIIEEFSVNLDNPFEFKCPYSKECGSMEAFNFPDHVYKFHSGDKNQKFACPICSLESDELIAVNDSTNLLTHLQTKHSDFKPEINIVSSGNVSLTLGLGSIEETLTQDLTNAECTICFADFISGQVIMRLECWCIYHKECIEDWYSTIGCRSCPVHKQNEQTTAK